jgi:3'(2'), 5'-bisphosphate nucleotidase
MTGSAMGVPRLLGSTAGRRYDDAMDDSALLNLAADLARQAGTLILAVRARGFDTRHKADASPVTEADHAAEALIVEGLRRAAPEILVVAEEEIASGHVREPVQQFWLVDPLDGTKEFSAGRDDFCVNIGLVRDGRPVLGVVGVPAQGELFCGLVGRDARKRTSAGEQAIRARRVPEAGADVIASRSHANDERLSEFLSGRKIAAVSNAGSALKFCRVAEGKADLYPRFGRTMEWDTAAPQAILEAAGGAVRTLDGSPLRYGKPGWDNPHFICTGID